MIINLKWLAGALLLTAMTVGCEDKPKEVKPEKSGERGSTCQAKNDCEDKLSCISGICQEADFDLNATAKECFMVECSEAKDCCGSKPLEPPSKCRAFDETCLNTVPGCVTQSCLSNDECNGGTCAGSRRCDLTSEVCSADDDCTQDECLFPQDGQGGALQGTCSLSGGTCLSDPDCLGPNFCGAGTCDCSNPKYDPADPLCDDEECMGVCTKICEAERCIEDNRCEDDDECVLSGRNLCDDGACVECLKDDDCDNELDEDDDDDECLQGSCVRPCQGDAQCGRFQACNADTGGCDYVGCRSDRECILGGAQSESGDARLTKCETVNDIGRCVVECEVDIHCSADETCDGNKCKYIGCAGDTDCKTILGLHNWEVSDEEPWIPAGECREVVLQ